MKLQPPQNPNYAATVVRVRSLLPLAGMDNVVAAPLLGYQAIVSKDTEVGDLGVLFTAETQLGEHYARMNNLHRHEHLNDAPDRKGYLEDTRRVKAIKFRGHRSDALLMPLSSLRHYIDPDDLTEGDTFDTLNGIEVCRKYVIPRKGHGPSAAKVLRQSRVDEKFLPKHFDTENYFRNIEKLNPNDIVYVTQKLHGTSVRIGHTIVSRKLKWYDKLAQKFGVKIQETEYDYVYGSRNVIKDANNPEQKHFYGTDLYSIEGNKLKGLLPKGYVVFGELIGWTPEGAPLQSGYTYAVPEGQRELYVYRVLHINPDGQTADLSWNEVKEFCTNLGLKYVPELWIGWHVTIPEVGQWLDVKHHDLYPNAVPCSAKVDEGVCIRRDGLIPLILKAKSPLFLQHETKMLDKGVIDTEEAEAVEIGDL